jgi:hypothetical protein
LTEKNPPDAQPPPEWAEGTPAVLPITTLLGLFNWYRLNLCGREIVDPRGCRVTFLDTDFVHLIKLTDKYGKEPKNRRMTIEQIQSGRIALNPSRIQIRRAQELSWARPIIENPTMIVPNWQAMGRAIPGEPISGISVRRFSPFIEFLSVVTQAGSAGPSPFSPGNDSPTGRSPQ